MEPCNSQVMTVYIYIYIFIYICIIDNKFFSVLCLDRAVLGRMNCPPLCTINPTSPVEHLQRVCSENAPSQVPPWLCAAQLAFPALWEGREQPGVPRASREQAVSLVLQHKACFVLYIPPCSPPWAAGNLWLQQVQSWRGWKLPARFYIYTADQNHTVKTRKYLNNFLFNFSCQPRDATLLLSCSA